MLFQKETITLLYVVLIIFILTSCNDCEDDASHTTNVNIENSTVCTNQNLTVAKVATPQTPKYEDKSVGTDPIDPKEDDEKKSLHGVDYGAQSYFAGNYTADYTDDYWDYSDEES